MHSEASVLFLGKADDEQGARALRFLQANFPNLTVALGAWKDPLPPEARSWKGDYIISYLSRWVVPAEVLQAARLAAINFHPAPPEYPGIGCLNFALYEESPQYGVTCHHMAPQVDTGGMIAVRRFPLLPSDTVASLLERTHQHLLVLFYEVISGIVLGQPLPESAERWTRRPFKRGELNELSRITPEMTADEIARRIRATTFGSWRPFLEVGQHRFELGATEP